VVVRGLTQMIMKKKILKLLAEKRIESAGLIVQKGLDKKNSPVYYADCGRLIQIQFDINSIEQLLCE
jgi:hypothetical protein